MYIMVDVESDGPCPGLYSMVSFGAVVVDDKLDKTFYGLLKPISDKWLPDALAVSGHTREQTMEFPDPLVVMGNFDTWIEQVTPKGQRSFFISDNNGYDWQWINFYFWNYLNKNPFGHSSTNLGSLYKGLVRDTFKNFKHLRKTKHTHNPVDDSKGNCEALLEMKKMGLKIAL
jgi:hypothetical protein